VYLASVTISRTAGAIALAAVSLGALATAEAQQGKAGPPAVGVLEAARRPVTESNEYLGRIKSFYRVAVTARVTAFLDKWNFVEGSEVKTDDLLYQLERGPFEADLKSKQAQVAQLEATLGNAKS
jgi:membrane fusion protein (multidrug efflux system)